MKNKKNPARLKTVSEAISEATKGKKPKIGYPLVDNDLLSELDEALILTTGLNMPLFNELFDTFGELLAEMNDGEMSDEDAKDFAESSLKHQVFDFCEIPERGGIWKDNNDIAYVLAKYADVYGDEDKIRDIIKKHTSKVGEAINFPVDDVYALTVLRDYLKHSDVSMSEDDLQKYYRNNKDIAYGNAGDEDQFISNLKQGLNV